LRQEKEDKKVENFCSKSGFKDYKEKSTLFNSLKRLAISRLSATQS
jgi:hypothetical protein